MPRFQICPDFGGPVFGFILNLLIINQFHQPKNSKISNLIISLSSVYHGPGDDGVVLLVCRVTPGPLRGHAAAHALALVAVLQLLRHHTVIEPAIIQVAMINYLGQIINDVKK